jgi:predicted dehydrogenase
MRIAFVGCGFVADHYARTRALHPDLEFAGVYDRDPERTRRFAAHHSLRAYRDFDELLGDPTLSMVLNLTSPGAHFEVSRACLEAGKHVYSEKPLALDRDQARALVELAEGSGLRIACAPCSVLGETAQTLWKALRQGRIGSVRAVYAEMDDGPLHRMRYEHWKSESGTAWPWKSEFETGCTLEHAAYQVSWLAAFFGPARRVTAFASVQVPEKGGGAVRETSAPDLSVACIDFESGVVARLTCSILAPRDHSLRIFGDAGVLRVPDTWHYRSPVLLHRWVEIRRRTLLLPGRRIRLEGRSNPRLAVHGPSQMDYLRGVAELASAIREARPARLSERFGLHVNEVVLAIHEATEKGGSFDVTSRFEPPEPMHWVR